MRQRVRKALFCCLAAVLLPTIFPVAAEAAPTGYTRMSTGPDGGGATSPTNTDITPDGRFVVFDSRHPTIGISPCGDCPQVYLHDRDTDEDTILDEAGFTSTIILSKASDGSVANDGASAPSISDDGRFVAFTSGATNLIAGDTNATGDVFVIDRDDDTDGQYDEVGGIEAFRASLTPSGDQRDLNVGLASLSGNGRFVAYGANERSPTGSPERWDISIADLDANGDGTFGGSQDRVYRRLTTATQPGFSMTRTSISDDGRFITYGKESRILLMDRDLDTDLIFDEPDAIEVRQIALGAGIPKISGNGTHVVWSSYETNLVPGDTNEVWDVFLYDAQTEATRRLSVTPAGEQSTLEATHPAISPDGNTVVFTAMPPSGATLPEWHLVDVPTGAVKVREITAVQETASLTNTQFAFANYAPLTQDDLNTEGDVFVTPFGFSPQIRSRASWEGLTNGHDVGFERLAHDASSCDPSPRFQSPLSVEGITVVSPTCFGTHFDSFSGDNSLELPVGSKITLPAGAKDVVLLVDALAGGRFSVDVTDGDGEERSVIGERIDRYPIPMVLHSDAGIAEIEVEGSYGGIPGAIASVPLRIAHVLVNADANIGVPQPEIDVYDNAGSFQADFPDATAIDMNLPTGRPAICNLGNDYDEVAHPYVWSGLILSTSYCFGTDHEGFASDRGTQLQLAPRTGGIQLTLAGTATAVIQAQRWDGSTITRFVPPPGTPDGLRQVGFGSGGGIARLRFLGHVDVRGVKVAALPDPQPESFSASVPSGGSASTGTLPSPSDPIETTVKLPAGLGGEVTISEGPADPAPGEFAVLGQQVDITAPAGTLADPLTLTFVVDASTIPPGYNGSTLEILRNGTPAGECPGATSISGASLDPCVVSRTVSDDGDVTIVVLTSQASAWNVVVTDETSPFAVMEPFSSDLYLTTQLKPAWRGSDPEGGPVTYSVQKQQAGIGSDFGAFTSWASTTNTTKNLAASPGTTYCFRVRAQDSALNQSPYSEPICAATPVDDRGLSVKSGAWKRIASTSAYRGTLTQATSKGAALRLTNVKARTLSLVASRCSTCGKADVIWNGSKVRTIDLKGANASKVVFPIKTFSSVTAGDLVVRVATSGKKVAIDGVAVEKL
jgi:Tol biopolymer transport system component